LASAVDLFGQELLSRAEGQSQAIINAATAEARAVKEIARSIAASGENPAKYLLAMKCVRVTVCNAAIDGCDGIVSHSSASDTWRL
jgi:hypothetical protein